MEKKYQIFISSTFEDLREERKAVYSAILDADCIPAGMENFSALDKNQFEIIKETMNLCDYYILIVGNRYGSIDESTGISYTEMEFDYATSNNIPKLCFVKEDIKTDDEALKKFIKKVQTGRTVNFWSDKSTLKSEVIKSIYHAIKAFERPGWIRGTSVKEENVENKNPIQSTIVYNRDSKLSSLENKIIQLMRKDPGISLLELTSILGYSRSAMHMILSRMIEKGYIKNDGPRDRMKWTILMEL